MGSEPLGARQVIPRFCVLYENASSESPYQAAPLNRYPGVPAPRVTLQEWSGTEPEQCASAVRQTE